MLLKPRKTPDLTQVVKGFEMILDGLFDNWRSIEAIRKTPERAAKALLELLSGYWSNSDPRPFKEYVSFSSENIIAIAGIRFVSICEHHLLPFFGYIHVGYIPQGEVIGLSKIPRIVEKCSRRLQIQERLTEDVAREVMKSIGSKNIIVVSEAIHSCECFRGIRECTPLIVFSCHGLFREDGNLLQKFLSMIEPYRLAKRTLTKL